MTEDTTDLKKFVKQIEDKAYLKGINDAEEAFRSAMEILKDSLKKKKGNQTDGESLRKDKDDSSPTQIFQYIKDNPKKTSAEIAAALPHINEQTIYTNLYRMKSKKKIKRIRKKWSAV